jgi:predicted component of type VI protein secretion system
MLTYPSRLHSTQNHQGSRRSGNSGLCRGGPSSHELFQGLFCYCTKPNVNVQASVLDRQMIDRLSNGLDKPQVVESLSRLGIDAVLFLPFSLKMRFRKNSGLNCTTRKPES